MEDLGRGHAERGEQSEVEVGVGAVVGAANDVRDAQVDVVGDGGEVVGGGAVGAQQCRPVRGGGTGEARRRPHAAVALAGGGACGHEALGRGPVDLSPRRLAHRPLVDADAEPGEVAQDPVLPALDVARGIGVVDTQDEDAAVVVGEAPVGDGGERVAEMERPGGARREADADAGGGRHGPIRSIDQPSPASVRR